MSQIVLVTGATSGFGKAIAIKFAAEGSDLIITGRRQDKLLVLQEELSAIYNVKVLSLCFDVRSYNEVEKALSTMPDEWRNVDVLINNAGLALGRESLHEGSIEQWNQMIDTNVKGLLYVTKTVAPWMIARKQGTIINIGSIAGREAYMGGNIYSRPSLLWMLLQKICDSIFYNITFV